jgi:hypothetical protein
MTNELEVAIQELEAKLPVLRRLLVESGETATTSPTTLALMARLLRVVTIADETSSHLRLALLGGSVSPPEPLPPLPPVIPASSTDSPDAEAPPLPPDTFADANAMGEADADLAEALGLSVTESEIRRLQEVAILTELERKLGRGDSLSEDEEPPGGALVGAMPKKPTPPRTPGNERTFAEAEEPARNP